jgi:hypothetical protein
MLTLTLNEAGFVLGQPAAAINRAVDRGLIKARLQQRGKHRLRRVGPAELRFQALAGALRGDLTPAGRRKVYEAMRRLPADAPPRVSLGVLAFDLAEIDRRLAERLQQLEAVKAAVEPHPDADPTLRGTQVSVYVIAALAQGETSADILSDYPELVPPQIQAAVEYAAVYPRSGRPLPARSFKQSLTAMAESGVWDVADDAPA